MPESVTYVLGIICNPRARKRRRCRDVPACQSGSLDARAPWPGAFCRCPSHRSTLYSEQSDSVSGRNWPGGVCHAAPGHIRTRALVRTVCLNAARQASAAHKQRTVAFRLAILRRALIAQYSVHVHIQYSVHVHFSVMHNRIHVSLKRDMSLAGRSRRTKRRHIT
jgi:hypothetical protein